MTIEICRTGGTLLATAMHRWFSVYLLLVTLAGAQDGLLGENVSLSDPPEALSIELPLIELKTLLLEAKSVEDPATVPEALHQFLQLDQLQGFVEIEEEGIASRFEEVVAKVRFARDRFIVLDLALTEVVGSYATDIIGYDEASETYLKWRQVTNKSIFRMRGVALDELSILESEAESKRLRIAWSGEMKGRGLSQSGSIIGVESINGTLMEFKHVVMQDELRVYRESLSLTKGPVHDALASKAHSRIPLETLAGSRDGEPAPVVFEDFRDESLNFVLKHPGKGFTKIPAEQVNKDASLVLMSSRPSVFFMLLAEEVGVRHAIDAEMIASIAQGHLRNIDPNVTISDITSKTINGLEYQCFDSSAKAGAFQARYAHSITVKGGFAYQLVFWCAQGSKTDPRSAIDQIAEGFDLMDKDRVAEASDDLAPPYHDSYFGVRADLTEHAGFVWGNLAEDFPGMHYGVQLGGGFDGGVVLMPVDLRGLEHDIEGLTHASVEALGLATGVRDGVPKSISQGTAKGHELLLRQEVFGTAYRCRLRVLFNGDIGCLLAGWIPEEHVQRFEQTLIAAMDAVVFEAPDFSKTVPELAGHSIAAQGDLYNEVALSFYNRSDPSAAEAYSRRAINVVPGNVVYAGNLVEVLKLLGKQGEALAFIEQRPALEKEPNLIALQADLLMQDERHQEAITIFQTLFSGKLKHRDEDDLLLYLNALIHQGDALESVRVVEAFMAGTDRPSLRVRRWHMQALRENGDYERALEVMAALRNEAPDNSELKDDYIDLLLASEQADKALTVIATSLEQGETARLRFLQGRAHAVLENFTQAKEAFEFALTLAPNDPFIQQGLDLASAALGQGNQSSIKDPLEQVEVPASLREAIDKQDVAPLESGHHRQWLEAITGFHFQPQQPLRRTEFRVVRVLNRTGVQEESTLELSFDHVYERIYLHYLQVMNEAGEVVAEGQPSDYYVSGGDASVMATNDRILYAPVPGLQPGYTIRYAYTRQGLGAVSQFPFERFFMVAGTPTAKRAIFVTGRIDQVSFVTANGVADPTLAETYLYWLKANPPLVRFEPQQPSAGDYLPIAALGSNHNPWEVIGNNYLSDIEDRLEPSETMVTLAQQVCGEAEADTDEAKAEAILDWVRRSLSYQAIEFGARARTPNRGARIVSNRYGDCKDHSLVAYQLLKASGLDAKLSLIHNRSALLSDLPSLDQFNHMIIYLPELRGGCFVDCTSKDQSLRLAVPEELGNREALVLDSTKSFLLRTADYNRDAQKIISSREVSQSGDLDLLVAESVAFHGYYAGWIRQYLRGKPSVSYDQELQQLLEKLAKLEVEKVTADHLEDLNKPLVLRLIYKMRGAVNVIGFERRVSLPAIWERYFMEPNYTAERASPFRSPYPLTFRSDVTLALPEHWRVAVGDFGSNDQPWGAWQVNTELEDLRWRLTGTVELKQGQFPAESYQAYQQDLEQALKLVSQTVVLTEVGH